MRVGELANMGMYISHMAGVSVALFSDAQFDAGVLDLDFTDSCIQECESCDFKISLGSTKDSLRFNHESSVKMEGCALFWNARGDGFIQYIGDIDVTRIKIGIRYLLSELLLQRNKFLVHGACVSDGEKTVLILGKADTGKTVVFLELIRRGFYPVSEDQCVVFNNDNRFVVHGFKEINSIKRDRTFELLPWLKTVRFDREHPEFTVLKAELNTDCIQKKRLNDVVLTHIVIIQRKDRQVHQYTSLMYSTNLLMNANINGTKLKLSTLNDILASTKVLGFYKSENYKLFVTRIDELIAEIRK